MRFGWIMAFCSLQLPPGQTNTQFSQANQIQFAQRRLAGHVPCDSSTIAIASTNGIEWVPVAVIISLKHLAMID
jgi:hypothetical protein